MITNKVQIFESKVFIIVILLTIIAASLTYIIKTIIKANTIGADALEKRNFRKFASLSILAGIMISSGATVAGAWTPITCTTIGPGCWALAIGTTAWVATWAIATVVICDYSSRIGMKGE